MNKKELRKQIIEMGNGSEDNPESWIEMKVEDLDYVLDKFSFCEKADE